VLRILETAEDQHSLSAELPRRIRDWPSRYHLSHGRINVLLGHKETSWRWGILMTPRGGDNDLRARR